MKIGCITIASGRVPGLAYLVRAHHRRVEVASKMAQMAQRVHLISRRELAASCVYASLRSVSGRCKLGLCAELEHLTPSAQPHPPLTSLPHLALQLCLISSRQTDSTHNARRTARHNARHTALPPPNLLQGQDYFRVAPPYFELTYDVLQSSWRAYELGLCLCGAHCPAWQAVLGQASTGTAGRPVPEVLLDNVAEKIQRPVTRIPFLGAWHTAPCPLDPS
jgi:hypothetical protein